MKHRGYKLYAPENKGEDDAVCRINNSRFMKVEVTNQTELHSVKLQLDVLVQVVAKDWYP